MLTFVGMPDPDATLKSYPFQLSGGMVQRVMIALSLACNPSLLIADEPTTALDVTIQAQILKLLSDLRDRTSGIILITHNLSIIASICDTVALMYAGKIVERGPVSRVIREPLHPYTRGLLNVIPRVDQRARRMEYLPGTIPSSITPPPGCRFSPRCPRATARCFEEEPAWSEPAAGHGVACHGA